MVRSYGKLERAGPGLTTSAQRFGKLPWLVLLGYCLPGLIGLCVWCYLRVVGIPGIKPEPLIWVLFLIPATMIVSLLWIQPFLVVALVASRLPPRDIAVSSTALFSEPPSLKFFFPLISGRASMTEARWTFLSCWSRFLPEHFSAHSSASSPAGISNQETPLEAGAPRS